MDFTCIYERTFFMKALTYKKCPVHQKYGKNDIYDVIYINNYLLSKATKDLLVLPI